MSSDTLQYYHNQVLAESHIVLFAGFCTVFFLRAVLTHQEKKYPQFTLLSAIFASLCVAAKISCAYIIILPLSLCWKLFKNRKKSDKKTLFSMACALIIPYVIVNPTVFLNMRTYINYIKYMLQHSQHVPQLWAERSGDIFPFLKEIYILNNWPNIILILLFAITCVLFVRKNTAAFIGFIFFFAYSFQSLAGMSFKLYSRHFIFLLIPSLVFFLFPFFYFYQELKPRNKMAIMIVCTLISLFTLPLKESWGNWKKFGDMTFTQGVRESRDDLADFVKDGTSKIYFYDYHEFSLPNDSHIIPCATLRDIPQRLGPGEFIGVIRYKNLQSEEYKSTVSALLEKYQVFKVFGPETEFTDAARFGPKSNPTIMLLKNSE